MASVNPLSRELVLKIVYYGPGLGGKTTTLEYLHASAKPEHRGKLVSLATPVDRTLYFDFLPLRVPTAGEFNVRLQLFTVPGQVYFNATRKLVLTGADGVVFVADGQAERSDANVESFENLRDNLTEQGRDIQRMPLVFQHNKQDLPDLMLAEDLDQLLNPANAPFFPTCALDGHGVYDALDKICEIVLSDLHHSLPERPLMASELLPAEGGLAAALKNASIPPPILEENRGKGSLRGAGRPSSRSAAPPSRPKSEAPVRAIASTAPVATDPSGDDDLDFGMLSGPAPLSHPPSRPLSNRPVPGRAPFTFSTLWPEHEREGVFSVEQALANHDYARSVELCDALVSRVLAGAAGLLGTAEAPRDVATVPLLLGLDGRQYLSFRATVRRARAGELLRADEALAAYTFALNARLARLSIR